MVDSGHTAFSFLRGIVVPLSWYGLGSVKDILELPVGLINRLGVVLGDPDMQKSWASFHGLQLK